MKQKRNQTLGEEGFAGKNGVGPQLHRSGPQKRKATSSHQLQQRRN